MKPQKLTIVLAAALFLSLSVNFFLAGLMLGDAVAPAVSMGAGQDKQLATASREQRRIEWQKREEALHTALSEADRAVMKESRAAYDAIFNELRTGLDAARAKVAAAMEAEPLDQESLDDAIAEEAAIKSRLLQEMTAARQKTLEQLSPEGRVLLRQMAPIRRGARGMRPMEDGMPMGDGRGAPPVESRRMPAPGYPAPEEMEDGPPPPHEDIEPPPPVQP